MRTAGIVPIFLSTIDADITLKIDSCGKNSLNNFLDNKKMEITCYRGDETSRETRCLPAITYNLAISLLARCTDECLFVPIRSMQYLAILNSEEFVFVDGERKCWVDIAWCNFRPQARNALDQAVTYQAVYYRENQTTTMAQLQREFLVALKALAVKDKLDKSARIIKFPGPRLIV